MGLDIVSISLDIDPDQARPFIDKAVASATDGAPIVRALIDTEHATTAALGFTNVPMALWVDETGTIVRPPESASIERSSLADMEISDDWPERLANQLRVAQSIPSNADAYRGAILDWAEHGAECRFAMSPDDVLAAAEPRDADAAEAVAAFELGQALYQRAGGGADGIAAARPWWQRAHDLDADNWTYKRQAWTLVTTPEGQPSDLMQGPNDVFTGNWLDDVVANGGGEAYVVAPKGI